MAVTVYEHALNWGVAIHSHLFDMGAEPEEYADWYAERYPDGDVSHPYAVAEFKRDIESGAITLNTESGE